MFAPPLYQVRKFSFSMLYAHDFCLQLNKEQDQSYRVRQQDNLFFRQIRRITRTQGKFNPYLIFVDARGADRNPEAFKKLLLSGFTLNGVPFVLSERSASMTRQGILSFVDAAIASKLEEIVSLGITPKETVLSKYYAYRGLLLSSCHCLENWQPKIVLLPDTYRTIPNQHIKYVCDSTTEFIDQQGKRRKWTQKDIAETTTDVKINLFDGCGVHHPAITCQVQQLLGSHTRPTSILWRAPFIKGMTHEVDYTSFFRERGISEITDFWGNHHSVEEPMILLTESMFKASFFLSSAEQWQDYWKRFRKYRHCLGVARWNLSAEEEPVYTRANYQILQDLDLPFERFALLAKESVEWASRIAEGDPLSTFCFLGITADRQKPLDSYGKAVLKDPRMLQEPGVRAHLLSLASKYIDEMKCGKLWIKSCFRLFVPDLILFLEQAGGLEPHGCLRQGECYTRSHGAPQEGTLLIERNPHICRSEHTLMNAVNPAQAERYCSQLNNVCMVNRWDLTAQRLNGADFDGDLVLVVDNEIMRSGVDPSAAIVLDVEDKVTAKREQNTPEQRAEMILRTMKSMIGEISNCATCYHNKVPKSPEQKHRYERYIDLLSVINGKSIDFAKTGVFYPIPRHIAKYGRPLPAFMQYAGDYYKGLKQFSHAPSNLNRLCRQLEQWSRSLRWKRHQTSFDYHIMLDDSIPVSEEHYRKIREIYLAFCTEMAELAKDQAKLRHYDDYREEFEGRITKQEARNFSINWQYYYDRYRDACRRCCANPQELANIAVALCYEEFPTKNKKFLWVVAADGVLKNLKQQPVSLPVQNNDGTFTYLGKTYEIEIKQQEESI